MFLRNFLHIYIQALKMMFVIALLRTICLFFITEPIPDGEFIRTFIMALRFDWLVISFLLIIPWLAFVFMDIPKFQDHPMAKKIPMIILWYWRAISFATLLIWLVNGFYFSHQRSWMWLAQWKTRIVAEPLVIILIGVCLFTVLFLFRNSRGLFWRLHIKSQTSHRNIYGSSKEPRENGVSWEISSQKILIIVVMISALLLFLGARGTVSAHHLRYEHSVMTKNHELNSWILSPLWTMSKNR